MRFATLVSDLSLGDLQVMADGGLEDTVTDMDFLETLAAHRCVVVPPWVMRVGPQGGLARLTPLIYDVDGQLNKARVLLDAARRFREAKAARTGFGGRFAM